MTPCSVVVGYQHFRVPCCLHCEHCAILLHGVTTQKTTIWIRKCYRI